MSKFSGTNMIKQLKKMRPMRSNGVSEEKLAKCMKKAHIQVDKALRNEKPKGYCVADFCGCTAVSCIITRSHYIVANLGDSRAILIRSGKPVPMSVDHKPFDDKEKARIERAGGKVFWGRVNGKLAVSRAIGDFVHKGEENVKPENQMVTILPDVKTFDRKKEDSFVVLACDGVWDVLSNEDVCNLLMTAYSKGEKDCNALAKLIVETSYSKGSTDNARAVAVHRPHHTHGRRTRKLNCALDILYSTKNIKLKQTKFIFKLQPSLLHPNLSFPCKCITSPKNSIGTTAPCVERATCNHTSSKVQNLHNLNHSCTTLVPRISKSIEVRRAFPKHWEIERWYFRSIRIS